MRIFLFLSKQGDSVPIAERIRDEGSRSVVCTDVICGDGLVEKTNQGEEILSILKPDCTYVDAYGIGKVADGIKSDGMLVLGASRISDLIMSNKNYRKTILKMCSLDLVSDGIPFTLAGWFNGKSFVCRLFVLEEKYLLDNDVGPKWKSRGCIAMHNIPQNSKFHTVFNSVENYLQGANYRGAISISMRASKTSFGAESIELNFSNALLFAFFDCFKGKIVDLLYGIASGVTQTIQFKNKWMASLGVGLLPIAPIPTGIELVGVKKENKKHLWLIDVVKKDNKYLTAGVHGDVFYISARGDDPRETRRRVYRTAESIKMEGGLYRTDVGKRTLRVLRMLTEWNYI